MSGPPPLELALRLAQRGRLYPGVILHGGDDAARREAAQRLARTLLCDADEELRPCGECRHCRRALVGPVDAEPDASAFHPDLIVLERDLRTSTSAERVRSAVRSVQQTPFEARGQVLVVTAAETLSGAAANALLKNLEEPGARAPRHFLLLCPTDRQLLPTLRSRSLALYLGAGPLGAGREELLEELTAELSVALDLFVEQGRNQALLLAIAALVHARVAEVVPWDDPRTEAPWGLAAGAFTRLAVERSASAESRGLLRLATALLEAPEIRLRAVSPRRILEGELARCLA